MIARFTALLPFSLTMHAGHNLRPVEVEFEGLKARVHPPQQGSPAAPMHPLLPQLYDLAASSKRLYPGQPTVVDGATLNDTPIFPADLIVIDFIRESFDRSMELASRGDKMETDPPLPVAFGLANNLLDRLRSVSRGGIIKPIDRDSVHWRIQYLNDDGGELVQQAGHVRTRVGAKFHWSFVRISENVWKDAWKLPKDFTSHPWDRLLMDAEPLMPNSGAAMAVLNAALETFAYWMNQILFEHSTIDRTLYEWVNDRKDWMKEPSVLDRYDVLLKVFTGKTLKDEPFLWEALKKIRGVRNNFMHQGRLAPKKDAAELGVHEVYGLLQKANEIVNWVEALLPPEVHRPKLNETITTEMRLSDSQSFRAEEPNQP